MPKCIIDGKEVQFEQGQNLVEVAKKLGIEVPVFCYHPGLSVVGQCRMCAVEIEKSPKLQTACSTAAVEGMVVKTRSERVRKHQRAVMEFLLINHPLDCPICDQSGECDLQEHSFRYGNAYSRYTEERRAYLDLDLGPVIKKNMNRCIHCTRCIRFGEEIAKNREMIAFRRGNNTEITTADGRPLETEYAGNYADICPVGSLTLKDFRFKKRAWFLVRVPTICEGCSRGCSIELHREGARIYRCVSRENLAVNRYWICDEGRFNFHYLQQDSRITRPRIRRATAADASWEEAIDKARSLFRSSRMGVLIGSDLTQEEVTAIIEFIKQEHPGTPIFHFGTPGVFEPADDADADTLLKRKSKTANLHGMASFGLAPFRIKPEGVDAWLVVRGGRATLPRLDGTRCVGVGVFQQGDADQHEVTLPGPAFAEKDGTVINCDGREQQFRSVIEMPEGCRSIAEILRLLRGQ